MKDVLWITSDGITDKVQYLRNLPAGREIKHVALADFRFGVETSDSVVMTYTATQDGTCGGEQIPSAVRASVVYTKGGGKWREALYVETPIKP